MTVSETRVSTQRLEAHSGVLVDPGWLAGHLGDPSLRVVEVDVSPAGHHRGAGHDAGRPRGTAMNPCQ